MKLDVGVQKVAAAARRQTTVKWGFIVGCFALLLGSAVLFSILLQGGSGRATYDFRTHTIFQDEADYAYLQENIDSLLQQLGQPPEGGVQIAERKSDENAQKANLVLERGVKTYEIPAEHLLYWLYHGGLVQGAMESQDYIWYFPVHQNRINYELVCLEHHAPASSGGMESPYSFIAQFEYGTTDGMTGYVFHPEMIQTILDSEGLGAPDVLMPLSVYGKQDGSPYHLYLVYVQCGDEQYFIPYGVRDFSSLLRELHLCDREEFLWILRLYTGSEEPTPPSVSPSSPQ